MSFENMQCKVLYIGKNGIWNDSQAMWDSLQTLTIIAENCLFNSSETLATYGGVCLCTHTLAHVCRLLPTYVGQWPLVCCCRQLKIKPILLKMYVVVRVRIVPTESI